MHLKILQNIATSENIPHCVFCASENIATGRAKRTTRIS